MALYSTWNIANAQETTFAVGLSGSYLWGGQARFYTVVKDDFAFRTTFGFTYRPERERFAPETSSYSLGLEGVYTFNIATFLPEALDMYAGGGFAVAYNRTTFAYKSYWAFLATPFVGITYDIGPELFLELGSEVDLSPYFNVTAVDFSPRIRLGIILFRF
ncbi:MAG: hypothetical protein ACRCYY_04595 [Trueperaceae bacterium]